MIPRHDRTGTLRSEAPEKNGRRARPIVLLLSLLLLSVGALLASCGGGPTVATPTGRTLYLATTSGIYGFSIMNDGTLQALSSSPLATGSYNQIAAHGKQPPLDRSQRKRQPDDLEHQRRGAGIPGNALAS